MPDELTAEARSRKWLERLQAQGYRLTAPRRAVVQVVSGETQRALNPTEIYDLAREHYPKLGLVTVYRTLEKLEELGLVQRVHQQDGCHAYIAGFVGHQHLLICERCGCATYFEGDDLSPLIARVEGESGYQINDHWLQLFGICQKCRRGKQT